jgi:uncharacterized membrane protein
METRAGAQTRADAIRVFQSEVDRLEREGVFTLTAEQRQALAQHHGALLAEYQRSFDIDPDAEAKQLSLGMQAASLFGAVALSASVFFLFYQFWGLLPTIVQVVVLVGAAAGTFAATLWIGSRDKSNYFTNLAAMIAIVCLVLDLTMLGKIFNITPGPTAFTIWAAVALLLAYECDLPVLLVVGIASSMLAFIAYLASIAGVAWISGFSQPENFMLGGLLLFGVPLLVRHARRPSFPSTYRAWGAFAVLVPILILSHHGSESYLTWDVPSVEAFYQILGFIVAAAVVWAGVAQRWSESVNLGTGFFVFFLYSKFVDWWWDAMPKSVFFLLIGLVSVGILLVLRRLRAAEVGMRHQGAAA